MNLRLLHLRKVVGRRGLTTLSGVDHFITTPIFYVNAAPHIGHLHSALVADALHRFRSLQGLKSLVFSTGTDEHGLKVQHAARDASMPLPEYCDGISGRYAELFKVYDVAFTRFIRTSCEEHKVAVQAFWNNLVDCGVIYKGSYRGWYCEADESFLTETQLKTEVRDGKQVQVSAESGRPVQWVEEDNYMFRLSQFKDDVLHWLKSERSVQPKKFSKILESWIQEGAMDTDVSVSRPTSRVYWGIPVPGDEHQTIYVWLDALINYLTVAGYPNLTHWPPSTHVIGKDILKFHGIYWPAFLIAGGLQPPESLLVHSHWTVEGEKMSKSLGNVVDPFKALEEFTSCGLRYFLLREATLQNDSNFSDTKIRRVLNAELADTLGNLLNRCSGKGVNPRQEYPGFGVESCEAGSALVGCLDVLSEEVSTFYAEGNFYKGIASIVGALREANKFFEVSKPWELRKSQDEGDVRRLNDVLHLTMEALRLSGIALQPVVPRVSDSLLGKLSVPLGRRLWSDLVPSWKSDAASGTRQLVQDKVVLYQKLLLG